MIKMFVYEDVKGNTRYCFCERTSQFFKVCESDIADKSSVFIHYLDERGYSEIAEELR